MNLTEIILHGTWLPVHSRCTCCHFCLVAWSKIVQSDPGLSPEDQVIGEVVGIQNFYQSMQLLGALQSSQHFLHQILTQSNSAEEGAQWHDEVQVSMKNMKTKDWEVVGQDQASPNPSVNKYIVQVLVYACHLARFRLCRRRACGTIANVIVLIIGAGQTPIQLSNCAPQPCEVARMGLVNILKSPFLISPGWSWFLFARQGSMRLKCKA